MAKQTSPARSPKKKGRFDRIVLWGIIVSLIAIVLLLWGPFKKERKTKHTAPTGKQEQTAREQRKPEIAAVVAIVVDDLGQDVKAAQDVLALREQVTLAVLPRLSHSKRIAELARAQGREVIVHMPMEAKGRGDKRPAAGMLRSDMTPMEFIATVGENLDSVPGAAGVNNHEGSALTENREAMNFLVAELKNRNLFLLDSMTSPKSQATAVAREFGLRTAKRDVFIDNESERPTVIRKQLSELIRLAKQNGQAIGIGHPHPATLEELRKWLPEAAKQGIEVVPLSRLVQ